jgi:transcriptional regulator
MIKTELKKGTAPLLVLALLEHEQRHGYELTKQVAERTNGILKLQAASLYPLLYRMEKKGWIVGRWVERPNERRRRFYRITASGRKQLEAERSSWQEFITAVSQIAEARYA